ncbi:hypothetical protein M5D96_005585, partial [Drosophila gunungcola]
MIAIYWKNWASCYLCVTKWRATTLFYQIDILYEG